MSSPATKSRKQRLDEDSFQQLLAAAFVVQHHNDLSKGASEPEASVEASEDLPDVVIEPRPAYAYVMEEIVATQHQIQTRRLHLQQAMNLIVERVLPIAHADGAAIAVLENDGTEVIYRAAVGRSSTVAGRRLKTEEALCAESLRNGTTLHCSDTKNDFRVDAKLCESRGASGIIAIPIYRDEAVAGALELIFSKPASFLDHDVRTCQVMAGMVTEALDRAADVEIKQALVNERATMLEALEKLKPQLERMVETTASGSANGAKENAISCAVCGKPLAENDPKCAHCGAARDVRPGAATQSKLASMVRNNGADLTVTRPGPASNSLPADTASKEKSTKAGMLNAPLRTPNLPSAEQLDDFGGDEEFEIPSSVIDELEASLRAYDPDRADSSATSEPKSAESVPSLEAEKIAVAEGESEAPAELESPEATQLEEPAEEENSEAMQLRITPAATTEDAWTSASKAKEWLESVTDPRARTAIARFLQHRRGEIYLTAAVLVVGFAIWWSVWGGGPTWRDLASSPATTASSEGSTASSRRRPKSPEPELSTYEKFLISLGLAEAPPAPINLGNPDVKVWVDLQTALYYCPNAEFYGKTPKGKFTTQRDAQLDQFEPAYRRACD